MQPIALEPIRQAVTSGEFTRARLLWEEFAAGLAEEVSKGKLSEALFSEVGELVEWSRIVALCARAHLQDQLNGLHVAREYELPVPPPAHPIVAATF